MSATQKKIIFLLKCLLSTRLSTARFQRVDATFSFDNRTISKTVCYSRDRKKKIADEWRRKEGKDCRGCVAGLNVEGIRGGKCNPKRSACGRFGLNELPQ
ncbi:hypothetical protein P5V15_000801 [Pogonomyrmex californicus]